MYDNQTNIAKITMCFTLKLYFSMEATHHSNGKKKQPVELIKNSLESQDNEIKYHYTIYNT